MEIPLDQIKSGQRWIIRPNDKTYAFMVEVLDVRGPGCIDCAVPQIVGMMPGRIIHGIIGYI